MIDRELMKTMTKHGNLKCDLIEQKYKNNDSTHKKLLKELKEVDEDYYQLCMKDYNTLSSLNIDFGDKPERIQKEEWEMLKGLGK